MHFLFYLKKSIFGKLSNSPYISFFFFIIFASNIFAQSTDLKQSFLSDEEKVAWLKNNAIPINSIDPGNEDYSDLQYLKSKLGNSRVILLGEQSHMDGSTFLMKARLIKFLVKEMGFNTILFEVGLFDGKKINADLKRGETVEKVFSRSIFGSWGVSEQLRKLFTFIGNNRNSIDIGGIDCHFYGGATREYLLNDLTEYIKSLDITLAEQKALEEAKEVIKTMIENSNAKAPSIEKQKTVNDMLDNLVNKLQNQTEYASSYESNFWIQALKSIKQQCEYLWGFSKYSKPEDIPGDVISLRDIQMGKNVIWQALSNYPNKKIIISSASLHISRSLQDIDSPEKKNSYPAYVPMGEVAYKGLDSQLYSIAFTAYQGSCGLGEKNYELEKPEAGSLEDLLYKTNYNNSFLDFRSIQSSGQWLRNKIQARPFGYGYMTSDWTRNFDGIIFIKDMVPSKMIEEKK